MAISAAPRRRMAASPGRRWTWSRRSSARSDTESPGTAPGLFPAAGVGMAHIRPLLPEDFPHAGRIFFCAVHEGTRNVYSPEQRLAWGGATIDLGRWRERIRGIAGFVAEVAGEPVGFMTLDGDGHV